MLLQGSKSRRLIFAGLDLEVGSLVESEGEGGCKDTGVLNRQSARGFRQLSILLVTHSLPLGSLLLATCNGRCDVGHLTAVASQ